MDADVFITIAFGLEVAIFATVGGIFIARELRKAAARDRRAGEGEPEPPWRRVTRKGAQ
jgi:hypothetical protein